MKVFLIECISGTFGQTEAGAHSYSLPERVLAEISLSANNESIRQFMKLAQPVVCHYVNGTYVEIPVEHSYSGLHAIVQLISGRKHNDPWVKTRDGMLRLEIGEEPRIRKGAVEYDRENLAYQRTLLGH